MTTFNWKNFKKILKVLKVILYKRSTNGQLAHEKMYSICSHKGNENQNKMKTSLLIMLAIIKTTDKTF